MFEVLKIIYSILLMLNILGFSALIFCGKKKMWSILIILIMGAVTDIATYLIRYNDVLIFGKETNAPFYHLNLWIDLIFLFVFFYSVLENKFFKKVSISVFLFSVEISLIPYLFLDVDFMHHSAWNPMFSKPGILVVCSLYFVHLLNSKKGYPFITIGVFMFTGCSLVDMSVYPFYEGVDKIVYRLRNVINLFPLIIMQFLFMYEVFLFFKRKNKILA